MAHSFSYELECTFKHGRFQVELCIQIPYLTADRLVSDVPDSQYDKLMGMLFGTSDLIGADEKARGERPFRGLNLNVPLATIRLEGSNVIAQRVVFE